MTPLAARTARALVQVLETGRPRPAYADLRALPGAEPEVLYGAALSRLSDGGLTSLMADYCAHTEARHAGPLKRLVGNFKDRVPGLATDRYVHNLLRAAADDPVMQTLQEAAGPLVPWHKAEAEAARHGLASALSHALVLEAITLGGWENVRRRTTKAHDTPEALGEPAWCRAYLAERRDWMANHRSRSTREAQPRLQVFEALMALGNWDLRLPIVVRGIVLDEAALLDPGPGVYDGPAPRSRSLRLTDPLLQGADVRALQVALSGLSLTRHVMADGFFGPQTDDAVRSLQDALAYPVTGVVEPDDWGMLSPGAA